MVLLAIVLLYVAGNLRALYALDRELKLVEKRQTQRLESTASRSVNTGSDPNTVPVRESLTKL